MKKQLGIICIALTILVSCSRKEKGVFKNDLETIGCWINQGTLCSEEVHSGVFSSKIDSLNPYSFGFSYNIGNIGLTPTEAMVNCWVYIPAPNTMAKLVVSVDWEGNSLFWNGYDLNDISGRVGEWVEVKHTLSLPAGIMDDQHKITIYIWSPNGSTLYADDFAVSFR